jgi:hypothetical protein
MEERGFFVVQPVRRGIQNHGWRNAGGLLGESESGIVAGYQ